MKFEEALAAMREGKKVKRTDVPFVEFRVFQGQLQSRDIEFGAVVNGHTAWDAVEGPHGDGYDIVGDDIMADDWQIID